MFPLVTPFLNVFIMNVSFVIGFLAPNSVDQNNFASIWFISLAQSIKLVSPWENIRNVFAASVSENFFPLPEPLIPKNISRVMSLRDGTKKMSKSEESDYSRINLRDSADEINKKIKKAKSDSEPIPDNLKSLEKKPEALNLLTIYSELSENNLEKTLQDMAGKEYSFLKMKLSEILVNEITPVAKEIQKLLDDKSHLKQVLKNGSEKANIIAEENLKKIRDIVGLL